MRKIFTPLILILLFCNPTLGSEYYFKQCKLNNLVFGDYELDFDKNVINVKLSAKNGTVQKFTDKIKLIEKDRIVSQKIKSQKGNEIYYQYFLNSKSKSVIKLEFKKESGIDMDMFRLLQKRESYCSDIKTDWNKRKIDEAKLSKEQKQILEAQQKIQKEQSSIFECQGKDYSLWTNCKGSFKAETGHKYDGLFKAGKIIKGISLYPGGAKYIGDFKNFMPHGYGNFVWANGDKYFGEWKDGKSNGNGTKIWNDGREYSGTFKNDKLHGEGSFYYPDGKKYVGKFINGKRHGSGTFSYPDGTSFRGKFIAGKQEGLGECISVDGSSIPCTSKADTQTQDFSGKETRNISLVAKRWIRISHYETNSKKGKKIIDRLKKDFDTKAAELCASIGSYDVLEKKIEVLEVDETPAYGLETKLKIGINGVVECK